jgi:hypothetical protein
VIVSLTYWIHDYNNPWPPVGGSELYPLLSPRLQSFSRGYQRNRYQKATEFIKATVLDLLTVGNNVNSPIRTSAIGLLQHLQLLYLPS